MLLSAFDTVDAASGPIAFADEFDAAMTRAAPAAANATKIDFVRMALTSFGPFVDPPGRAAGVYHGGVFREGSGGAIFEQA
jgi:hypothetical protein